MADATLSLTVKGVIDLGDRFAGIDLSGTGPPPVPWGEKPSVKAFEDALASGAPALPYVYFEQYAEPLGQSLDRVLAATREQGGTDPAETLLGAVYDHAGDEVRAPLRRFLFVVSDLYSAFLDDTLRARLRLPLVEVLPPLATFRARGTLGPYTYTADTVQAMIGSSVGVVSLPSTYRLHPLLWGTLAHETGGHDVIHADPGLLAEMDAGLFALFGSIAPQLGRYAGVIPLLWSHWLNEAASDCYGTLNMGPAFALGLIPWLMAFRARTDAGGGPVLLTDTINGPGGFIDTHPPDQLRVDLAIGAIASLRGFNRAWAASYIALLQEVEEATVKSRTVSIGGYLPLPDGTPYPLQAAIPLPLMRATARLMGAYIVTAPFAALAGRTIQDIESWNDTDEALARQLALASLEGETASPLDDASQILAGGTLAAISDVACYDEITLALDAALDAGAARDPIWGTPVPRLTSIWASLPPEPAPPSRARRLRRRRAAGT